MTDDTPQQLEDRLWKELKGSSFAFVGLFNDPHGDVPMTLVTDGDARHGIWIFTKRDNSIASGGTAMARLISKEQDFFARLDGTLARENNPDVIDRLWSPHIAAWYDHGRDDPDLTVMRFDMDSAEVWRGVVSPLAAVKMMLGQSVAQDMQAQHGVVSPNFERTGHA